MPGLQAVAGTEARIVIFSLYPRAENSLENSTDH